MKVMGIDPSTKTGWACLTINAKKHVKLIDRGELRFPAESGIRRVQSIGRAVADLVEQQTPDLVVLEGYGYANKYTLVILVEIGTGIRLMLHDRIPWVIAAPTVLKKFVTGKGSSKKDSVMVNVYKNWGFEGSDNECDAFGLAALGLYASDPEIEPTLLAPQMECVSAWRTENLRIFV